MIETDCELFHSSVKTGGERPTGVVRDPAWLLCMSEFHSWAHGSARILCVSIPQRQILEKLAILVAWQRLPAISVFDTLENPAPARRLAPEDVDRELLHRVQGYLTLDSSAIDRGSAIGEAWERFFARFDPLVRATVLGCSVSPDEFEDCVQEAWIEIAQKLPALRFDAGRGRLQGWLCLLVRRRTLKCLRQIHQAARNLPTAQASVDAVVCFRFHEPPVVCRRRESRERLHAAVAEFRDRVSATSYGVLQLISLENRSVAETGRRLGLAPSQVWARHHRAKAKLRQFLQQREEFSEIFENPPESAQGARCPAAKER
ncbi:MAG: sigma-70 family RNA polymerase sigma factor [Planctomycetaceae bacterium]|nr:MAG: sigma-70 family RNA polymerase sigma factor [Planctomycetaceae bacterium]